VIAGSDSAHMRNLARGVRAACYYSHGLVDDTASMSGHGTSRLLAMMEEVGFDKDTPAAQPMGRIGDEEQYAALLAVLARSIDIPARVGMGIEVPEGQEGAVAITGDDVTGWAAVAAEGIAWAPLDPAPGEAEAPAQPAPEEVE